MIRVNQAGEYGAVQIYKGQLKVLSKSPVAPVLKEMLEQEYTHLQAFNEEMARRGVRPTLLEPFWRMAGWTLGVVTAFLGEKEAMACTVAVEDVIDQHYAAQDHYLQDHPQESPLRDLIQKCRQDECHHRDLGYHHQASEAMAFPLLTGAIKTASRLAIWISKRL